MKRVGSLKSVFKPNSNSNSNSKLNENNNDKDEMSILGNCSSTQNENLIQIQNHKDGSGSISIIPKGLSNFFHKNVPLKGTLTRNKNKEKHSVSSLKKNYQVFEKHFVSSLKTFGQVFEKYF